MTRSLAEVRPGARVRELALSTTPGWTANNPSIADSPDDGWRFTVRSSNFTLDESEMVHQSLEPEVIRTKTYVGRMTDDLEVIGMEEVDYSAVDGEVLYPAVVGVEDCRIFWDYVGGLWRMSGTYRQHRSDGMPTVVLDSLGGEATVVSRRVFADETTPQKNWMPTGFGDNFFVGPWTVNGTELRGSSQALRIGADRWIGVVHFVTWPGRRYWHALAAFDGNGAIISVSEPFYFLAPGVEFANGAAFWDGHLVVSFGHKESRCFLAYIPYAGVERSLIAVNR